MFVRATVTAKVGAEGAVLASSLDDKWICPMHPEVVADEAGDCSVCGMDLVKAETLGYSAAQATEPPLVLPSSAVLITGKRALVYVRVKGKDKPTFEGREVELGPRAGDSYIVRSGIEEGDDVVVNGNFKIDSALQLVAKPSMMSPEGGVAPPAHHGEHLDTPKTAKPTKKLDSPQEFKKGLSSLVKAYYGVQRSLAGDDSAATTQAAKALHEVASTVPMTSLKGEAMKIWHDQKAVIEKSAGDIETAEEIQAQRLALPSLTSATEILLKVFGPLPELNARKAFCPMAFDNKGAYWLQEDDTIANPYFGDAMLRCGEIKDVLSAPKREGGHHEDHR
jgi:Cu(I)/Ag(I) efflux system membrane fusion protein